MQIMQTNSVSNPAANTGASVRRVPSLRPASLLPAALSIALATALCLSAPAYAQAPLLAKVLASQPNITTETIDSAPICVTVKVKEGGEDMTRTYIGVGAVIGGALVALATKNLSSGVQLAATGAGVLAGGYAGAKVAESQTGRKAWSFNDDEPAKVTPVAAGANEATSCHTEESTRSVQQGFVNLLRVRDQDIVVRTENALTQGSNIRVFVNQRGDMEIVR